MGKDHLAARKKTPQVETGNKRPKRALLLGLVSRAGSDQSPQSPRANFDSSRSKITEFSSQGRAQLRAFPRHCGTGKHAT